nr:MAG TPA: nucleoid-associated protein [Caudoviricetes sp.]
MSEEKRVAAAEILNTSVRVSVNLNDRYQGPPGPPGKDGDVRFEDLTAAQIEQLRGPQGLTGKTPQITVQVETGEPGTEASVIQSGTAEAPVIALTIPRGDVGATPQITVQVKTGEPGTDARVEQSGTPEEPQITLTIPRGDTGSLGNLTINGKTPDSAGKVELTAADVGALSGTDATLTQEGKAADAKATGDELNQLKSENEKKYSTEVLWENAAPNSSFDEQTVTFDWKAYNYCMIYFRAYVGSGVCSFSAVAKKGDRLRFYFLTDTEHGAGGQFRDFYTDTSHFGKAVRLTDSTSIDQKACVPIGIYGVKGV